MARKGCGSVLIPLLEPENTISSLLLHFSPLDLDDSGTKEEFIGRLEVQNVERKGLVLLPTCI